MRYLVDDCEVGVINVSMGTFLARIAPKPMRRAVDHCYERGVILVAAAGNVPAPSWPAFPAALQRSIAVAGVTAKAVPWSGSSYGSWVDFSAPAKAVRRATTTTGLTYGYTAAGSGTTFAAAMTTGAAALWLCRHAQRIAADYREPWQRVEAFRLMARREAITFDGWHPDRGFGAGILNVAGLMCQTRLPSVTDLKPR